MTSRDAAHESLPAAHGLLRCAVSEKNLRSKESFRSPLRFRPAKPFGESACEDSVDHTSEFNFSFLAKKVYDDVSEARSSPTEVPKSPLTTKSSSPPRTELGSTTSPSLSDRSDDESLVPQSTNSYPSTRPSPRSGSEGEMEVAGIRGFPGERLPHWEQPDSPAFFSSRKVAPRMDPCLSSLYNTDQDPVCQELLRPSQLLADQTLEPMAFAALLGEAHASVQQDRGGRPDRVRMRNATNSGASELRSFNADITDRGDSRPLSGPVRTRRAANYDDGELRNLDAELADLSLATRDRSAVGEHARIRAAISSELRCLDAEMADLTFDLLDLKRHISDQRSGGPN